MKKEGTVSTIHRHIEVQAPPSVALATWSHFVRWVMTGHQRLACDELACVDAVRAGLVRFEPVEGGSRTDVSFNLECDEEGGPSRAALERSLDRDLVVFKDYMERGDNWVGKPTRAERRAMIEDEGRHQGGLVPEREVHGHVGAEDQSVNFRNHFPT
jgi:hypothetical protein